MNAKDVMPDIITMLGAGIRTTSKSMQYGCLLLAKYRSGY